MNTLSRPTPWYREPWPWLLISGPALVVVAALATAWIAYTRGDPVLSNDYYREGLAVEQTIASSQHAIAYALQAELKLDSNDSVTLRLKAGKPGFTAPASLRFTLSHPTRAGLDQTVLLQKQGEIYTGHLHLPASGHWLVLIESPEQGAQDWRMLGKVILPATTIRIVSSSA